ncbi:hypothetical protein BJ322DRAFT_363170 [Thelephora terrestris]|uniref:Uncharacterized protein n=1 Tax=Thelephora terrestris TaxID=56493 RepID=A0A9P6H5M6_9AGAM|nr:hypothetical protein BJ322DRAFT_363170 [Thelephora terrestris]
MDKMTNVDAILFPADDRLPHLVPLMTSDATPFSPHGQSSQHPQHPTVRVPHPEMYMDFIPEGVGSRVWRSHVIDMLDGMNKKFENPYVIYYPVLSRDGMPFPVNEFLKKEQGASFRETHAWRGNLVVAKYRDERHSTPMNATMADFPLLKNYLITHSPPGSVTFAPPGT